MAAVSTASASADPLTGAGSTLVAPLMANWIATFEVKEGIPVKYGAVGSGTGISQITARTVDFGASDAPLTPEQATACNGCVQIPWALSATGLGINIPGVKKVNLTGSLLAEVDAGEERTGQVDLLYAGDVDPEAGGREGPGDLHAAVAGGGLFGRQRRVGGAEVDRSGGDLGDPGARADGAVFDGDPFFDFEGGDPVGHQRRDQGRAGAGQGVGGSAGRGNGCHTSNRSSRRDEES